jgi:selenocysteine lyase/cysteine desulfurase
MAIAALERIHSWRVPRIAAALSELTGHIAAGALRLGLNPLPDEQRGPHMLGVRLPETVRSDILPALAAVNCYAAVRGESLRISPHLHITDADTDRLLTALEAATQQSQTATRASREGV